MTFTIIREAFKWPRHNEAKYQWRSYFTIVRRVSAIYIIIFRVLWKYVRLLSTHQTCRWLYIYPTVAIQRALAGGQQQTPFLIKQYWLVLSILLPGCFNKQHISWKELAWRTWNRICICDKVIHRNVFKCAVKDIHVFFSNTRAKVFLSISGNLTPNW